MNERWFDKIEAYLDGKMPPREQAAFESELAINKELASAVRIYHTIETEMRSRQKDKASEALLKQTLEEASVRYFKGGQPADTSKAGLGTVKKIPSRTILAVAAAVVAIFTLSSILYFFTAHNRTKMIAGKAQPDTGKRNKDTGALVKSPDKPLKQQDVPITSVPVKDSSVINKTGSVPSHAEQERMFAVNFHPDKAPKDKGDLEDELGLYEEGNYKEAIAALEDAKSSRGSNDNKLEAFYRKYYLALSYMADRRVEKAIPELEAALKESPDGFKRSKAQWYLALAWLKKGEWTKAEGFLNELAGNKQAGEYKGRAAKLIQSLANYREK